MKRFLSGIVILLLATTVNAARTKTAKNKSTSQLPKKLPSKVAAPSTASDALATPYASSISSSVVLAPIDLRMKTPALPPLELVPKREKPAPIPTADYKAAIVGTKSSSALQLTPSTSPQAPSLGPDLTVLPSLPSTSESTALAPLQTTTPPVAPPATSPVESKDITSEATQELSLESDSNDYTTTKKRERYIHLTAGLQNTSYDYYDPRLRNGDSLLGIGFNFPLTPRLDLRSELSFTHPLDQKFTAENTRMTTLRIDPLFHFSLSEKIPFHAVVGLGLGYVDFNLRSYELVDGSLVVLRQYTSGQSLALFPQAGLRFNATSEFSVDLLGQYSMYLNNEASKLNSFGARLSVGFHF